MRPFHLPQNLACPNGEGVCSGFRDKTCRFLKARNQRGHFKRVRESRIGYFGFLRKGKDDERAPGESLYEANSVSLRNLNAHIPAKQVSIMNTKNPQSPKKNYLSVLCGFQ